MLQLHFIHGKNLRIWIMLKSLKLQLRGKILLVLFWKEQASRKTK